MAPSFSFTNGFKRLKNTSKSALLYGNLRRPNPILVGQSGNFQYTDEFEFLDGSGGAATACLLYGNKRMKKALIAQLDTLPVGNDLHFRTAVSEEFAQALIETTGGQMARVFHVNSGSDATETAVKLAKYYFYVRGEDRSWVISRRQSYHGNTMYALSLSGHEARREPFKGIINSNVSFVSPCNEYRDRGDHESVQDYVSRLKNELMEEFERIGPGKVAAFIAEPVVGAALGCVAAVPGYFKAMKEVCEQYGALFIADEVMCGSGRTGTFHAWQQEEGFVPDIQTMGKAITGGYSPVGVVLANHKVCQTIEDGPGSFPHGFTYQGHPMTCAAGLEIIKIIQEDGLLEKVQEMGHLLEKGLKKHLGNHPHVGDIRGRGAFWALEFVKDKRTKEPFELSDKIATGLHQKGLSDQYGIYFYPGTGCADSDLKEGIRRGDHIILAPPYDSTKKHIDMCIQRTARVVNDFFRELEYA